MNDEVGDVADLQGGIEKEYWRNGKENEQPLDDKEGTSLWSDLSAVSSPALASSHKWLVKHERESRDSFIV